MYFQYVMHLLCIVTCVFIQSFLYILYICSYVFLLRASELEGSAAEAAAFKSAALVQSPCTAHGVSGEPLKSPPPSSKDSCTHSCPRLSFKKANVTLSRLLGPANTPFRSNVVFLTRKPRPGSRSAVLPSRQRVCASAAEFHLGVPG